MIVLLITLADPVGRLIRLELRYQGRQEEIELAAKAEKLEALHAAGNGELKHD
jgi:hypothetical protein